MVAVLWNVRVGKTRQKQVEFESKRFRIVEHDILTGLSVLVGAVMLGKERAGAGSITLTDIVLQVLGIMVWGDREWYESTTQETRSGVLAITLG